MYKFGINMNDELHTHIDNDDIYNKIIGFMGIDKEDVENRNIINFIKRDMIVFISFSDYTINEIMGALVSYHTDIFTVAFLNYIENNYGEFIKKNKGY